MECAADDGCAQTLKLAAPHWDKVVKQLTHAFQHTQTAHELHVLVRAYKQTDTESPRELYNRMRPPLSKLYPEQDREIDRIAAVWAALKPETMKFVTPNFKSMEKMLTHAMGVHQAAKAATEKEKTEK